MRASYVRDLKRGDMKQSDGVMRWLEHILLIILLVIVIGSHVPFGRLFAGIQPVSASSETPVEEYADGLSSLLPDIGAIYRTATTYPLHQVREEITSPNILAFYDGYLRAAGLAPDS